jgi:nucleotide-binding universal stress UspA family protein
VDGEDAPRLDPGPVEGTRSAGEAAQEVGPVFQKVLLAVDGSEHSAKAVPVAADIARKSDGEVFVFHVREFTVARGGAYELESDADARALLDHVRDELAAGGVKADGCVQLSVEGHAAAAILHTADQIGADAIVMGSRGLTDFRGLLLGSVTHKVIQLSHRTVVVAR